MSRHLYLFRSRRGISEEREGDGEGSALHLPCRISFLEVVANGVRVGVLCGEIDVASLGGGGSGEGGRGAKGTM